MPIRMLDATVAAQIAAGEVVERPASVVKELVENALDAGAGRITVEARGGGLREIRVQDDGCGIPAAEVELAFERHATSKLSTADELWALGTLGFRGEALPSIASVSQLICLTRAAAEELGTELRIAGGELQARAARGCSPGTVLSVRNLFYNAPVRREFLRSEATEQAAIAAVVQQYALAYPRVRFTLLLDGRLALQTHGDGDLRAVLIEIYGLDVARQLLPVDARAGEGRAAVTVRGLVSPPGLTRSSRGYIHLAVNRRAIEARGQLVYALEEAYHTMLMKGRHPLAVLQIEVDPATLDVNVHPTKSEVKFLHQQLVAGAVGRAVRQALIEGADVHPWDGRAPDMPDTLQRRFDLRQLGRRVEERWAPDGEPVPGFSAGPATFGTPAGPWEHQPADPWEPPSESALPARPTPARTDGPLPALRLLGQVGQTYIVADSPEGLYLIDQHAAHERITYERLMARHASRTIEQQGLLFPQTVPLSPEALRTVLAHLAALAEWGFEVEEFGGRLLVRGIPAGLAEDQVAEALTEVADHLAGRGGSTPADWREAMLTTLACHSSIRAHQSLSASEMQELVAQLAACVMPRTCPHGRPTMILLSTNTLERQFGRTQ